MSRSEFPVSVRKAALVRADGVCECGCGQPFNYDHPKERPCFDHDLPDFLGGENDLENCKAVRVSCHQIKTYGQDMPMIKKVRRSQKDRANLKANKATMPGSKGSKWKRKINGPTVRRD